MRRSGILLNIHRIGVSHHCPLPYSYTMLNGRNGPTAYADRLADTDRVAPRVQSRSPVAHESTQDQPPYSASREHCHSHTLAAGTV